MIFKLILKTTLKTILETIPKTILVKRSPISAESAAGEHDEKAIG